MISASKNTKELMAVKIMKRRLIYTVTAALLAAATVMSGCANKETEKTDTKQEKTEEVIASGSGTSQKEKGSETDAEKTAPDGTPVISSKKLDDCITLCDLENLRIEYSYEDFGSDDAAVIYAKLEKEAHALVGQPDATVAWGDKVDMNITSIVDGKKTDDFTYEHYLEPVGSKTLDEEIEKELIGKKAKDEFSVKVSYDKDYGYETFAGKTITYEIKINQIARPDNPTEEEIKKAGNVLSSASADDEMEAVYTAAKRTLIEKSTFKAYPETYLDNAKKNYEQRYVDVYGSIDKYLEETDQSEKSFEVAENEYVISEVKEQLLFQALKKATGIDENNETYKEQVGETTTDSKEDEILYKLILDAVLKDAVVQKK